MRAAHTHTPVRLEPFVYTEKRVLVVSDPATCPNVARAMASVFRVEQAKTIEQALARLRASGGIDAVVSERNLADGTSGLDVLAEVVRAAPQLLRVLVAGPDVDEELELAIADRLVDWVVDWPWTPSALLQPIRYTRHTR